MARNLYEEASSAGYITVEAQKWRWRYAMCADYLTFTEE